MGISESKMKIVIENYFRDECDINTSIHDAYEKGFRTGVKKAEALTSSSDSGTGSIGYRECADALLKMWMYGILTDRKYSKIAERLNDYWGISQ